MATFGRAIVFMTAGVIVAGCTASGGDVSTTSTEGTDEYNRDLSQRRATAVADALVELGFQADAFVTGGLGESEPIIFPEPDEAARAINRRVEILCD